MAPIRHVVVLVLENRSFDQMLGGLQPSCPGLDGIDPAAPPRENYLTSGPPFQQLPMQYTITFPDPRHELEHVRYQIAGDNAYFVLDYAINYPDTTPEQRRQIMGYYPAGFLEATHTLASNFTVCDQWFASVPGPTWTNRLFVLSGTSLGRVRMPESVFHPNLHWYDQDTIFDRLDKAGVSWRVYAGDFPLSLLFVHQLQPENLARYRGLERFTADTQGPEADFPAFVFIEPHYIGDQASDDHPPHDVINGELLIASTYNAIRANDALWKSTLLVTLFDEHGGFYDHVCPPADAIPPDEHDDEFDFKQFGVRVPALLVSPWVERAVVKTRFDHTSLLKYVIDKWSLGMLGNRTAAANTFAACIRTSGDARTDTPGSLQVTTSPGTPVSARVLTENEQAIVLLSQQLDTRSLTSPSPVVTRVARAMANSPTVRDDVRDQLRRFLARYAESRPEF